LNRNTFYGHGDNCLMEHANTDRDATHTIEAHGSRNGSVHNLDRGFDFEFSLNFLTLLTVFILRDIHHQVFVKDLFSTECK
jgi:hypothetical protein